MEEGLCHKFRRYKKTLMKEWKRLPINPNHLWQDFIEMNDHNLESREGPTGGRSHAMKAGNLAINWQVNRYISLPWQRPPTDRPLQVGGCGRTT